MSGRFPLSLHRRIERQLAESFKALRKIGEQTAVATERTLQLDDKGSLIPIPVRTVVDRRRFDQGRVT